MTARDLLKPLADAALYVSLGLLGGTLLILAALLERM